MIEAIAGLVETMPGLAIGAVVGLFALYPVANVLDFALGQPRKGNRFDKNRTTKVQDLYRRLGVLSLLIIAAYATTQSAVV